MFPGYLFFKAVKVYPVTLIETHMLYALAWISFGAGHSFLANAKTKQRLLPVLGPYYRLAYNIIAGIHIFAVWLTGIWLFDGIRTVTLPESVTTGLTALSVFGIVILLMALREYDLGLLAGTTQIRHHRAGNTQPDLEPLHITGLHAYVRHPIYLGAYMILWGGATDDRGLATALWGSLYLFVGTVFEERYLLKIYGQAYQAYQQKVPSIFPWRGRALRSCDTD